LGSIKPFSNSTSKDEGAIDWPSNIYNEWETSFIYVNQIFGFSLVDPCIKAEYQAWKGE